jgi:hypothetical protein
MINVLIFLSGLVFGIGLIVSGMTNPSNVIDFLDLAGHWNPSLGFVMLGAIPVAWMGFHFTEKRQKTFFNTDLELPGTQVITKELIIGSLLFGAGWAIGGFCPGPALVALGSGSPKALAFVLAMLCGMYAHDKFFSKHPSSVDQSLNDE